MISKDQAVGWLIFLVCITIAIIYCYALFLFEPITAAPIRLWVIAIPVLAAFMATLGIGAWIGLTIATTPKSKITENTKIETN